MFVTYIQTFYNGHHLAYQSNNWNCPLIGLNFENLTNKSARNEI